MQAGTYPARGYATLELSGLELSFTGAYARASSDLLAQSGSTPAVNLPAPDRSQLLYFPFSGLQEPVFLLNSRLTNFCCSHINMAEHIAKLTLSFFAEFLKPPSPVYLSLLDSLTCVGLRYGQNANS